MTGAPLFVKGEMAYDVGRRLAHHTGTVWEVVASDLPGDGSWQDGMIAMAGDYRIRCVYGGQGECVGNEMRVHRDYLHGDSWRLHYSHVVHDSGAKLHLARRRRPGRAVCGRDVTRWNEKSAQCWDDNPEQRCKNCEWPLGPKAVIKP